MPMTRTGLLTALKYEMYVERGIAPVDIVSSIDDKDFAAHTLGPHVPGRAGDIDRIRVALLDKKPIEIGGLLFDVDDDLPKKACEPDCFFQTVSIIEKPVHCLLIQCQDPDLNWGHGDFQSPALPTELSRPVALATVKL